jgi:hypothetical protein
MNGFWPIFFLAIALKIPVAALLYTVYWAIKATPDMEEAPESGGGHEFRRFGTEPNRPRGPRRGPHAPDAAPLPNCPPAGRRRVLSPPAQVRAGTAHARGAAEPER